MSHSVYLYQFSSIEEFIQCLTVDHHCTIYIWNNDVGDTVGFFVHCDVPGERESDELLLIVVLPTFQGQGYGGKMMDYYLGLLKDKKKSIIFTHEKNTSAISFYESLGYVFVKKVANKYVDGQTRVLMEKRL